MTRVLLLEDDQALGEVVRDHLFRRGHHVIWFTSLDEAREVMPPIGFDVLLCDYELSDGTGIEFLSECAHSWPVGYDQPMTILWSGLDRSEEVAKAGLSVDMVATKDKADKVLDTIEGRADERSA